MKANKDALFQHVDFLTRLSPARNYNQPESLQACVDYIYSHFEACGFKPLLQSWVAEGNTYQNVIASYNAHHQKRLVVGAHYDVCGDQPGADDNASAVAGLLECARMVFEAKPELDYRIDFVAYCLEEPPFFATDFMGSHVHAQSLKEEQADVLGMICFEMIGYFSDLPNSQPFPSPELASLYPNTANFIIVVGIEQHMAFNHQVHRLMRQGAAIDVQVINFPNGSGLAGLSDQRNYWKFGYPALMINDTSFIRNPNYHQKSDTIETLDFDKMTAVVDCAFRAITGLSKVGH